MQIVITYNYPHRKTQDILFRLKLQNKDVLVIAVPYEERKQRKPLIQHRPTHCIDIYPGDLCRKLGFNFVISDDLYITLKDIDKTWDIESILIGGCGIIDDKTVEEFDIINAHPGYIPYSRGLDSLKWAILHGYPVGVTAHYISKYVDLGEIICRKLVDVYYEDSFFELAMRVYNTEIDMLSYSWDDKPNVIYEDIMPVNKRMSIYDERRMLDKFEQLRKNSPSKWS